MIRRRVGLLLGAAVLAAPRLARATPARIISVGGALTETVFALGEGSHVIAVDSTSFFPDPVRALPQIGYMRALPSEGILSLSPDLLLLSGDAGPREVVEVLKAARMPIATVEDGSGAGAAAAKARAVGAALGVDGETLARALEADWALLDPPLDKLATRARVLFVLSVSRGAPMVSGTGTHADALIRVAGGINVVQGFSGYRPLSAEAGAALAPDIIVMMDHALREAGMEAVLKTPALAVTPAVAARRILSVDPAYALAFGPRAAHARRDVALQFHPGLTLPTLPERPWMAAA